MKNTNDFLKLKDKFNSLRKATLYNGCLHEDESCDKTVSRAHSVQENGILSRLSRRGEVLCIDFSRIPSNGQIELREIGKHKASTFTGFCNHHDSIFNPIEYSNYVIGNREQEYLFAYRAFALGYYERYSTYQFFKARLSQLDLNESVRHDLEMRCSLYEEYLKLVEKYRIIMNTNLDKKRFNKITTDILVWPEEYGIAVSSMIAIFRDLHGITVNSQENHTPTFFTVFPQNGKTYILMGYFTKEKARFQEVSRQIKNCTIEQQKIIVSNMIACKLENFFISPDWWEAMDEKISSKFLWVLNKTLEHKSYDLVPFTDFNIFQKSLR